jgi:hypothetical protein
MKKRRTIAGKRLTLQQSPPLLYLARLFGFGPQFYRAGLMRFNNRFRFFYNPVELARRAYACNAG